jgi:hypothetical protein
MAAVPQGARKWRGRSAGGFLKRFYIASLCHCVRNQSAHRCRSLEASKPRGAAGRPSIASVGGCGEASRMAIRHGCAARSTANRQGTEDCRVASPVASIAPSGGNVCDINTVLGTGNRSERPVPHHRGGLQPADQPVITPAAAALCREIPRIGDRRGVPRFSRAPASRTPGSVLLDPAGSFDLWPRNLTQKREPAGRGQRAQAWRRE